MNWKGVDRDVDVTSGATVVRNCVDHGLAIVWIATLALCGWRIPEYITCDRCSQLCGSREIEIPCLRVVTSPETVAISESES